MTRQRKTPAKGKGKRTSGDAPPPALQPFSLADQSQPAPATHIASGNRHKRLLAACALVLLCVAATFAWWRTSPTRRRAAEPQYNAGYVDSQVCENCHKEIAATYRKTGMGRSFFVPTAVNAVERYVGQNVVGHPRSGMTYTMVAHDGNFFQRRSTRGADGRETNVLEEKMDYVIGSGNHARAYLHRAANGLLVELPISWYAEKGGYWQMTPGFDSKGQSDMHGTIGTECMFCHNGYPTMDEAAARHGDDGSFPEKMPSGIDCQRCHGPGAAHVDAARKEGTTPAQVRAAIVNPARLPRDRQLEVCFQCHLETSNRHSPAAVLDYKRDIYSYRPGQPLGDYKLYFERPEKPKDDDFEIAHAGYQLPKSACFRKSQMTCLTCHNPHDIPHGPQAIQGYVAICQTCHAQVTHTVALPVTETCISCHMPKRRTDGSVHVVLTDHYIQRNRPLRDLLAPFPEKSFPGDHTPVELYYPKHPTQDARTELLTAIAKVEDGDGKSGIVHLQAVLDSQQPTQPEPYLTLARAYVHGHRGEEALPWFERALSYQKDLRPAMQEEAVTLLSLGRSDRAITLMQQAVQDHPNDDQLLTNLGNAYLQQGARTRGSGESGARDRNQPGAW